MLATRMRNLRALAAVLHEQAAALSRDIDLATLEGGIITAAMAAPDANSAARALAKALGFMDDAAVSLGGDAEADAGGVPDPYLGTGAPVDNLISFPGAPQ